ncbi:MAG: hypothetical protein Q4F95_13445 [Oscillospiraceae bacterium]|nr:hypothetical protein [Oscillospiraceae bacterium]
MHKLRNYVLCVFISIALFFSLLATQAVFFVKISVMNSKSYCSIVEEGSITFNVYKQLESYYDMTSNTTGISSEVFMNNLTPSCLKTIILSCIQNGFEYINGTTDKLEYSSFELNGLNKDLEQVFSEYADDNSIEKDAEYNTRVNDFISQNEAAVFETADVYQFTTLDKMGYLKTMRTLNRYFNAGMFLSVLLTAVLIVCLFLANKKNKRNCTYWIGISLSLSSLICLAGASYLNFSGYFNRFAVKSPHIYTAITSILHKFSQQLIIVNVILLAAGVGMIVYFIFRGKDKRYEGMDNIHHHRHHHHHHSTESSQSQQN